MKLYDLSNENETQILINILTKAIQSTNLNFMLGSGASMPAINTLGNIELEVEDLFKNEEDVEARKKLIEFLQKIYRANNNLLNNESPDMETTKKNYLTFLELLNAILINREGLETGNKMANIYTTNYDLLLEYACEKSGKIFHYNDGFKNKNAVFSDVELDVSEFDKTVFCTTGLYSYQEELPKINLIKMHGSLNWQTIDNNKITHTNFKNLADEIANIDINDDSKIFQLLNKIGVIQPYHKKHANTVLNRTYYNLLRYFSNSLLKPNSLFCSLGFSFADEHIYDIVSNSLKTNPTLCLFVCAYDEDAKNKLCEKFKSYNNVLVIYDNKLDFEKFNVFLQSFLQELIKIVNR